MVLFHFAVGGTSGSSSDFSVAPALVTLSSIFASPR